MKFYRAYNVTELSKIPARMGLYSWHLKLSHLSKSQEVRKTKFKRLFEVHNNERYQINATRILNERAKFGEKYEGYLNRISDKAVDEIDNVLVTGVLLDVFNQLSTPLYIGKSKNLNVRLDQHWASYGDHLSLDPFNVELKDVDKDSPTESKYFGGRLAWINKDIWFNENELQVKIYLCDTESYEQLSSIEYYLNRTIKPLLGIN